MPDFTTSDGKRIYFTDTGSGQPLLCLPGLTRCSRDFSFLAPHMVSCRMIAMDWRGRGNSDYDPDFRNYNVAREYQDTVELLDHLGLDKVTVLGTSRGGLIAVMMASNCAERLSGVILNDVGPVIAPDGIARILDYVGKAPVSKSHIEAARVMKAAMDSQFPGVPLERWLKQVEIQFNQTAAGLELRYDPALKDALLEQAAAGPPPDLWPLFQALESIPTGVIRGINSDVLALGTLMEMQWRYPALISAEVPDRGHVPFLDEPQSLEVMNKILEAA